MEFKELQDKDKVGAFENFVTIEEAKLSGLLMEELHSSFEERCACGSEIIISKNLTRFTCCDPRCYLKLGDALDYVFKQFACKGIGPINCGYIAQHMAPSVQPRSHIPMLVEGTKYDILAVQGMAKTNFNLACYKVRTSELSFPKMVTSLGIPTLGPGAEDIFRDMHGSKDLLDAITMYGGVRKFLQSKGVEDKLKCFYLHEFLQDIIYAEFNVFTEKVPVGKIEVHVCITGAIHYQGKKITKNSFVSLCNKESALSPSFRLFEVKLNSAVETNEFIIADGPSDNEKYIIGKRREAELADMGIEKKIVFTPEEFMGIIHNGVKVYKDGIAKKLKEDREEGTS